MKIARLDNLTRQNDLFDGGESDSHYEKRQMIVVGDNYDFGTNGATNITSLYNLHLCYKRSLIDYPTYKLWLVDYGVTNVDTVSDTIKGVIIDDGNLNDKGIMCYNSTAGILEYTNALRNNYKLIKNLSDFPTPINGIIYLEPNTSYEINGQVNIGTNKIETGISNIIYGIDKSDDVIIYTGTGALLNNILNNFTLRMLSLVAPLGDCINFISNSSNIMDIGDCIFTSSDSVGNFENFYLLVFRNNFITENNNGISISGTNGNFFYVDNVNINCNNTFNGICSTSGSLHTVHIDRNLFEIKDQQLAVCMSNVIIEAGAVLANNTFESSTSGIYLSGFDANSTNWHIPPSSNLGIAGLHTENISICTGSYSTTSSSFGQVPETHAIKEKKFYEKHSTNLKGVLTATITHSANDGQVEIDLYNLSDSTSVTNSIMNITVTSGGVYQIEESVEFDLEENKEYRVRIRRLTGTGQNLAMIRAATLEIKVY